MSEGIVVSAVSILNCRELILPNSNAQCTARSGPQVAKMTNVMGIQQRPPVIFSTQPCKYPVDKWLPAMLIRTAQKIIYR